MILSDDDIKRFIQYPEHADDIARASLLYRQHIRHVKGIGVTDFFRMEEIKGFENDREKLLREKISRATTVPIFSNALSTFDKAYSASGYSRYFEFKDPKSENLQNELQSYLNANIGEGLSMSGWMQHIWGDKIHYDFNGILMVELPSLKRDDDNEIVPGQKKSPYLIFKSIRDIHDYEINGLDLEYLILNQEINDDSAEKQDKNNSFQYFRVIDDARDLIARVERGNDSMGKDGFIDIVILDTIDYPIISNIWEYVPAIIISNQRDAQSDARQSFIWESIGTADDYLLDSSIHNISKKKHGFPQKWSYAVPCKQCGGDGKFPIYGIKGENDITGGGIGSERPIINWRKCSDCENGSIYVSPSVSVTKPMPDAQNPDIGEPFGYVTPPIDSLKAQTEELDRLEEIILNAVFPTPNYKNVKLRTDITATGEVLGVSAKQDKLNKFSSNGERVEEFLTDTIAKAIYGDSFSNSIVRWGRKYYIYSEDELETMFQSAKNAGVSSSVLKSYLEELIYVRYGNDAIELQKQLKLFQCEPLVYMTAKDVQALQYCAISDKFLKTYFNDYIEQLEREQPDLISLGTPEDIIAELNILNDAKIILSNTQTSTDPNNPANQKQLTIN